MDAFNAFLGSFNGILWSDATLYTILIVGILFLMWTKFSPLLAVTHGFQILLGKYDKKDDPGAISHFQALSAALSATVGLGNIGGVAIAVALGGPGAVFWMWVVGLVGMALKTTEVTLSMLYRDTSDPNKPRGGPMWVAKKGFKDISPRLAKFGTFVGGIFCCTLLISAVTGGNMFQSWNVAEVTYDYFSVPKVVTGIILALITGAVIIGGIKRIGAVAGKLVPFMCAIYLVAGLYVLIVNFAQIPSLFALIFESAFNPTEATGAFLGGTFGYAFLWGMKRALFSNEAGQGSAPIAHSAAKTDEPVREGVLAGLEPFIDTLVVCTITALVILSSGAWNRGPEGEITSPVAFNKTEKGWTLAPATLSGEDWREGQKVFVIVEGDHNPDTGSNKAAVYGTITKNGQVASVSDWTSYSGSTEPVVANAGVFGEYRGASLTAHSFDLVAPGLGMWMITLASWLFAISTMISWSYYGEQGAIYLLGEKSVLAYKLAYCGLVVVATLPIVKTTEELGNLTDLGTGVMLVANIPICLIMGKKAMEAYHSYVKRLKAGEFNASA